LGVGTNHWRHGANDASCLRVYQTALDADIDFFDTAEIYNGGQSELLLGACRAQERRPALIASKFCPWPYRLTRSQFLAALDASRKRLSVETIDLYYIHWPFTLTSVESLMDWMVEAVTTARIRAIGVSNFSAAQMRRAATRLAQSQIPLAANEVHYSLMHRKPEFNGVLDACRELDVALVAYRPLASGRLAATEIQPATADYHATLTDIATAHNATPEQVALSWLLRRDSHVIPIPGATNPAHLRANAAALDWEMNDDEFARIDRASTPR
jgi:aryl-alcohol dehydrogenase-like predicted oxidoreductase